jgi:hypothetical protein
MTVTATPLAMARCNQKPAPTGERVMVASDALLSVFSSLGCWILSKKAHGGSTVALGETLHAPIHRGGKLPGLRLGVEGLGRNDITLPTAKRPSTLRIADEHGRCGLGGTPAELPVLADGCGLGFGSDLAAEAAQLLCCFVLHGGVYRGKLTTAGSDGAAFVRLPESVLGSLLNGANAGFFFGHAGAEFAEEKTSAELAVNLGNVEASGLHGILASGPHIPESRGRATAHTVLVSGLAVDHGENGGLELRGVGECGCVHDEDKLPNRLGYAREISNYFHGPKTRSFSPLNAPVLAQPGKISTNTENHV